MPRELGLTMSVPSIIIVVIIKAFILVVLHGPRAANQFLRELGRRSQRHSGLIGIRERGWRTGSRRSHHHRHPGLDVVVRIASTSLSMELLCSKCVVEGRAVLHLHVNLLSEALSLGRASRCSRTPPSSRAERARPPR